MGKLLFLFIFSILFVNCKNAETTQLLDLDFIEKFPQKVIITKYSKNYVDHHDTININNESERKLALSIERPQYLYIQVQGKVLQIYLEPHEDLKVSKLNDQYTFEGSNRHENSYLQEILNNQDLKNKEWNYNNSFKDFKDEVDQYFKSKEQILALNVDKRDNEHFYNLQLTEDKALKNSAYLSYINNEGKSDKDSLFNQYFDKTLLEFPKLEPYLDAFYSKMGVEYFLKRKYGEQLKEIRKEKEFYILREDIISEYFPQPIKSMLIYNDLKYYPLEFDYLSDSLNMVTPIDIFNKYEAHLSDEAFSTLVQSYELTLKKKESYKQGTSVPKFSLKDQSLNAFQLNLKGYDRMVLLDVWASWCKPCIVKFPEVRDLENQYTDKLAVISISIDQDINKFKEAVKNLDPPGKLKLYAVNGFQSSLADFFQIRAIPRYILIDNNGKIVNANISLPELKKYLQGDY